MSTERGNGSRTRAQKHKNRTVFRNDMHDRTPKQLMLNSLHISEVCQHCKGVLEWKIKYKKYKPLTQPKTCTRCQQRNIRKAYHVLCRGCALDSKVCAKCLKSAEEVEIEPPQPTPEEELKLKVEMDRLVKHFPERKRRAFTRYMKRGKKQPLQEELEAEENNAESKEVDADGVEVNSTDVKPRLPRIPHSRDDLLKKIEQLMLATGLDELDLGSDSDADYCDSDQEDDGEENEDDSEK